METAFYIKEAFLGETGLAGTLRKLPVEKKFRLEVIKAVCINGELCDGTGNCVERGNIMLLLYGLCVCPRVVSPLRTQIHHCSLYTYPSLYIECFYALGQPSHNHTTYHHTIPLSMQIVREADGYQPHLVSPERGLRRLIDECIQMAKDPVQTCVERVYSLMVSAAGCV